MRLEHFGQLGMVVTRGIGIGRIALTVLLHQLLVLGVRRQVVDKLARDLLAVFAGRDVQRVAVVLVLGLQVVVLDALGNKSVDVVVLHGVEHAERARHALARLDH